MTIAIAVVVTLAVAWVAGAIVYMANGHESYSLGLEWPWRGLAPPPGPDYAATPAGRMSATLDRLATR